MAVPLVPTAVTFPFSTVATSDVSHFIVPVTPSVTVAVNVSLAPFSNFNSFLDIPTPDISSMLRFSFILNIYPSKVTSHGNSPVVFTVAPAFSNSAFKSSRFASPTPFVVAVITANRIFSKASALLVFCFASVALFKIPLSPLNALIVTAANISNTIIVMTSAISVIPFCFLVCFNICFPSYFFFFY